MWIGANYLNTGGMLYFVGTLMLLPGSFIAMEVPMPVCAYGASLLKMDRYDFANVIFIPVTILANLLLFLLVRRFFLRLFRSDS